jgi:hypothetical protein
MGAEAAGAAALVIKCITHAMALARRQAQHLDAPMAHFRRHYCRRFAKAAASSLSCAGETRAAAPPPLCFFNSTCLGSQRSATC